MTLKRLLTQTLEKLNALYGRTLTLSIGMILVIGFIVSAAVFVFFNTAAPTTITIASGPPGSSYQKNAEKYQKILARDGIKVKILSSEGSTDNLKKLLDPKVHVDVAFVQGGELNGATADNLMSLGSIAYQPLMIFYRGQPKSLLSDFRGQRLDIGDEGSGTHTIALALLKANGIEPNSGAVFVNVPGDASIQSFLDNKVDALFVMGDSTSSTLIRQLLHTEGIQLFNFAQADGYTRRINYLNKLTLPQGAIDFGKNIPSEDVNLIAPTVELIARKDLHPALSDALLEAAREVHGTTGLFRKRGEFPAPQEHEFPISPDAQRFYTTGKSFLYRTFPFWVASLINRLIAVILPIGILLVPGLKIAPAIYRWRVQSRIYPWYKALLEIERDAFRPSVDEKTIAELMQKLDRIEATVNKITVPASFGDMFYGLRGHINFVRGQLHSVLARVQEKAG